MNDALPFQEVNYSINIFNEAKVHRTNRIEPWNGRTKPAKIKALRVKNLFQNQRQ